MSLSIFQEKQVQKRTPSTLAVIYENWRIYRALHEPSSL